MHTPIVIGTNHKEKMTKSFKEKVLLCSTSRVNAFIIGALFRVVNSGTLFGGLMIHEL